ncbi:hypothetical protein PAXINDRAFT_62234, partial [Paxillus involutus ATCC 200175]
ARWTPGEVTALVDYLHDHRAERGEAGNFKDTTYNAAAAALRPLYNNIGAIKTGKMVGSKWAALKATYNVIESYRSQSGVHWGNDCGANIQGEDAAALWTQYLERKGSTAMKPFRNNGWGYYEKIHEIFPS